MLSEIRADGSLFRNIMPIKKSKLIISPTSSIFDVSYVALLSPSSHPSYPTMSSIASGVSSILAREDGGVEWGFFGGFQL